MTGGLLEVRPGRRVASQDGPRRSGRHTGLALCAGAGLSAAVLLVGVVVVLADHSAAELGRHGFRVAASALFLAASVLRLSRWQLTHERSTALMCAAYAVMALVALPTGALADQVVGPGLESPLPLAARTLGTVVCLGLVHQALDARLPRTVPAVAGVGLVTAAVLPALDVSDRVPGMLLAHVGVQAILACAWVGLGLVAFGRDATQPWTGRLAPLLASMGLVELLLVLDHLQPGMWSIPAAALLSSVAMVATHSAWVDFRSPVRTDTPQRPYVDRLDEPSDEPATRLEVGSTVAAVVDSWRLHGTDVRLRGGTGVALARATDLRAVLDTLLENAARQATGSPVTVHVVAIADRVEVAVTDHGPGLSAAEARRVFEPAAPAGLGTARALVRRAGGDLTLRTRIGAPTFVVSLPAATSSRAPEPADPRHPATTEPVPARRRSDLVGAMADTGCALPARPADA